MDLFPLSLAASRILFLGELHSLERDGHQYQEDEGYDGQAAEHGLEETELHVIQEEVHEACDEEGTTAYPYYERDGLSREADLLMTVIALKGAVSSFQDIAGTLLDGYALMAIGALSGFHGLAYLCLRKDSEKYDNTGKVPGNK